MGLIIDETMAVISYEAPVRDVVERMRPRSEILSSAAWVIDHPIYESHVVCTAKDWVFA